ncbi:hypothetical protein [Metabacillus litoralis]|uniref:hypothetical protein n=1 Tax=Metabacillus litoralis TaxID=152268 RepID=UPI00203DC562|nr:hypothetical protein [Metabacillus litoralis]
MKTISLRIPSRNGHHLPYEFLAEMVITSLMKTNTLRIPSRNGYHLPYEDHNSSYS